MVTFANLAGFWALLGIPVILFIHFLQRQSQIQIVSTLFLLEALDRESVQGRKLDRIRNSIPLWLQLLAVLLLTWILVQPRWMKENSVQKIAIVLDSSASMRAFKDSMLKALRKELPELSRGAKTVELMVMESHIDGEPIFNGTSFDDLDRSLEDWTPFRPAHDPGPALRVGRSLAGSKGIVLYVTDHAVENPGYDSKVLAVGEAIANVGFAGVDVDPTTTPPTWQAMVKNYGATPQSREWFLQAGQQRTDTRTLDLEPGETRTLQGRFPAAANGITLQLVPDRFDQDDLAPMVVPQPKELAIANVGAPKLDKLMEGMVGSFENTIAPTEETGVDLILTTYNPLSPTSPEDVSIVLLAQETPGRNFFKGPIVAANHPLVTALNWQGLIARSSPGMPVGPEDTILLWQGDRALIILRENATQRQLIYNFDVPSSNVEKLPSFIVLCHRFVESIRDEKVAPSAANHELNQPIRISCDRSAEAPGLELIFGGQKTLIPLNQIQALKAPNEPGFFEIRQGDQVLLTGASQFVDTREADFSEAKSIADLASLKATAVTEHTKSDDIWQIWLLLILISVLLSWFFINRKTPGLEVAVSLLVLAALPALTAPDYEKEVRPVLEKHCFKCHGPKKQKGKVRLDTLATDFVKDRRAAETWHDAQDSVSLGEMPPEDETALSSGDRKTLTDWIDHNLTLAQNADGSSSGGVVMRRLNRAEYEFTMRDLLGFEMDYTASLPPDSYSEDGFLNNGSALKMSGMLLEAYLETAREAMSYVLVEGDAPEKKIKVFDHNFKAKGKTHPGQNEDRLGRNHYWSGSIPAMPRTGPFTIRVTARAERTEDQAVPVLVAEYGYFVGGLTTTFQKEISQIAIASTESKVYESKGRAEFFPQPDARVPADKLNGVVLLYNGLKDGIDPPKPTRKEIPPTGDSDKKKKKKAKAVVEYQEDPTFPKIIIEKVEFVQNDYPSWPPPTHKMITGDDTDLESDGTIKNILAGFLRKAWRRPVGEDEVEKWSKYYETIREGAETPIMALREILSIALASNQFLYLTEPHLSEDDSALNQHELASRLSYFLWSSMPDQALSDLADSGRLSSKKVLRSEFDRMMNDEKSERFIDQFATQWLDLDAPDRIAINPQYYKDFDETLKPLMVKETREFFAEVMRNDLSALSFLGSDFTMANKQLAVYYGLSGPKGADFEKVFLAGSDRVGGLLGHAAMHMAGSDGANSHPIKRAVWIRERLLHDPPKPPPPNVPSVEESVPNFEKLTVREQMEIHREKEACADCHRGIDPWGIAMEQYDAIGLNRDGIDASTELPGGVAVSGIEGLQTYLLEERSDQFAHAFVSKMMIYALGRNLDFSDKPLIDELSESLRADGYRIKPMMKNIITLSAFLNR